MNVLYVSSPAYPRAVKTASHSIREVVLIETARFNVKRIWDQNECCVV